MKLYNISKPCTIWADPNGFLTRANLWKTIKDCEEQIKRNVERDHPDDTFYPLYLKYRRIARLLVIKYNAQRNAPSLHLNVNLLIDVLRAKKAEARAKWGEARAKAGDEWWNYDCDIKRLEEFRSVYRVYRLLQDQS